MKMAQRARDGADDGDAAVLAGSNPPARGDQVRIAAECLTKLAAHGVSGSFGESCRSPRKKNIAGVRQKYKRRGDDSCD